MVLSIFPRCRMMDVAEQSHHVTFLHASDDLRIESVEHSPEVVTFVEHGLPREATLEPFEIDFLEKSTVVGRGETPLGVVILAHGW